MKRLTRVGIGCGLAGLLLYFGLLLIVALGSNSIQPQKADAIIVLGAQAYYPAGRWNPCLKARVERGVELFKAGYAPALVLSGGIDEEDGAVEAEVMQDIAAAAGLARSKTLLESRSTSTAENLRLSKPLFEGKKVLIVSDPFHLARAGMLARKIGLEPILVGAPKSPCWSRFGVLSRFALREPLAIIENFLRGNL
ncbi:MAG: YdcF family protein [Deinococcales bacterium]